MTTKDIKNVQILIETKDGQVLVGTTDDVMLIRIIASYVRFVKVDKSRFTSVNIKELL